MSRGVYRQPPPPFIGGHQPLAPRKLPPEVLAVPEDAPPPRSRAALFAIIAASWIPDPPPIPEPRHFPQEGAEVVVDGPHHLELGPILAHYRPAAPYQQRAFKLNPSILAADPPPVVTWDLFHSIINQWHRPVRPFVYPVHTTPDSVDDPPALVHQAQYPIAAQNYYQRRVLYVPEEAEAVDDPPPFTWVVLNSIIRQWVKPSLYPTQYGRQRTPDSVDDPPPPTQANMDAIVAQWRVKTWAFAYQPAPHATPDSVDDPPPWGGLYAKVQWRAPDAFRFTPQRKLQPDILAADPPPPYSTVNLFDTLIQWQRQPSRFPYGRFLPPEEPAPVDDPPLWRQPGHAINEQWQPDPRLPGRFPYQRVNLNPFIMDNPDPVDDPPPLVRNQIALQWYKLPSHWPTYERHAPIDSVDEPPVLRRLDTIRTHWRLPTPDHFEGRKVPLDSVDDPPPVARRSLDAWYRPSAPGYEYHTRTTPESVDDPPPRRAFQPDWARYTLSPRPSVRARLIESVDNPPPRRDARALFDWQPGAIPGRFYIRRSVPEEPAQVDNPPPLKRGYNLIQPWFADQARWTYPQARLVQGLDVPVDLGLLPEYIFKLGRRLRTFELPVRVTEFISGQAYDFDVDPF